MTSKCHFPILVHRGVGRWECSDPTCELLPSAHAITLPCQWGWPYAHGRVSGDQPFPITKCSSCRHIRRAGHPKIEPPALPLLQVQP